METAWRFRIMLFMAFTMILFGDMLGYGNVNNNSKNKNAITNSNNNNNHNDKQNTNKNYLNPKDQALEETLKKPNRHKIDDQPAIKEFEIGYEKATVDAAGNAVDEPSKEKKLTLKEKINLANNLREACLPKLLCEIAAKPSNKVTEKEQGLLDLIKTTTLSLVWHHTTPTRWHFAAHMGQLMRDTIDSFGRPVGCAELWPQCPFSSQLLLQLSKKNFIREQ